MNKRVVVILTVLCVLFVGFAAFGDAPAQGKARSHNLGTRQPHQAGQGGAVAKVAKKSKVPALLARDCGAKPAKGRQESGVKALSWDYATAYPGAVLRYAHAQDASNPESFYVMSGLDSDYYPTAACWRYDSTDDTWNEIAPIPTPAEGPAATAHLGKIYVAGGWSMMGEGAKSTDFFIYDIPSNDWSTGADLPRDVWGAAMGAWNGKVYLVGGEPATGGKASTAVNIYDIATDTWTGTGAAIPVGVLLPGYFQVGQYLYVVGGIIEWYPLAHSTATQRYDMASNTWETGPEFTSARADFALVATVQKLYAIGGADPTGGDKAYMDLVESLDYTLWPGGAWVEDTSLPGAIASNSAGFCTPAGQGGIIWSVAGYTQQGPYKPVVDYNLYSPAEPCAWGPSAALNWREMSDSCPSDGQGDGDGFADPGETLTYQISVANTGSGDLHGVQGILTSPTPGVTVGVGTSQYGDILQGQSGTGEPNYVVTLGQDFQCGAMIDFQLTIVASEGTWIATFQQVVGNLIPGPVTTLLEEHFESWPLSDWMIDNYGGTCVWQSNAVSGNGNFTGGTGDAAEANSDWCGWDDYVDSGLITPPIDLSDPSFASARLRYLHNFVSCCEDYGAIEVSTDGWNYWDTLKTYGNNADEGPGEVILDLTPYLGFNNVQIRFYYYGDYAWFFQVDDVYVEALGPSDCTMTPCEASCTLTCTSVASATAGQAPLPVYFLGIAFPTGCQGTPEFRWDFDGDLVVDATGANAAHTYATPGDYTWTLWVSVEDQVCTRTGTVHVCSFVCNATATPSTGSVPLAVTFSGGATVSPNCLSQEPTTYAWDFNGDGVTDSTLPSPTYTYTVGGTYTWKMTVTQGGMSCTYSGTVVAKAFTNMFLDDTGKAMMCVNTTTGAWRYQILTGIGMGNVYTGIGRISWGSGVFYLTSQPNEPAVMTCKYYVKVKKAFASLTFRPTRINSYLNDSNTTNNPPGCN